MTTAALTTAPMHGDRFTPSPAAPNYALRRMLAVVLLVAVAAVLITAALAAISAVEAMVDLGGRPAAASEIDPNAPAAVTRAHVAQPGDTLWSIADTYRGDIGRSGYIDALIRINGGTAILVGQAVVLP